MVDDAIAEHVPALYWKGIVMKNIRGVPFWSSHSEVLLLLLLVGHFDIHLAGYVFHWIGF